MAITSERLQQTFSEGCAQEIYQEVKSTGDFLGFSRQYAFSQDYRVARSALWGLTKACKEELSQRRLGYRLSSHQDQEHLPASASNLKIYPCTMSVDMTGVATVHSAFDKSMVMAGNTAASSQVTAVP